jgi:hypothetical protein
VWSQIYSVGQTTVETTLLVELERGQEVARKVCGGVDSGMGMSTKVVPAGISVTTLVDELSKRTTTIP